jgi:hypothetical protein
MRLASSCRHSGVIVLILLGATVAGRAVATRPAASARSEMRWPAPLAGQPMPPQPAPPADPCGSRPTQVSARAVDSDYAVARRYAGAGFFTTGQAADILLSGIGFNDAGGPLLFNHPGGIAADGTRLLLADRNNNRVLVWLAPPRGNTLPDLVLGQPDFTQNDPGTGLDQMNWPSAVAVGGGTLAVADSENDRLLIWLTFPTRSGQAADLALDLPQLARAAGRGNWIWPWGVWTDGRRLVATSTHASPAILIWNEMPDRADQGPDVVLDDPAFGTPRQITSDGRALVVWDHNAKGNGQEFRGTFFWRQFPASADASFDFLAPFQAVGAFTADGRLVTAGSDLRIWNGVPGSAAEAPQLTVATARVGSQDGVGVALAGGHVYILDGNGNRIVGYDALPTRADQPPDFVIGSPDLCTNTLATHFIMSNPVPATDGRHLFVSSDFDAKLYVWDRLPDQDNAHPDWVYTLPEPPWDNTLWNGTLALAGARTVYLWHEPPLGGEPADLVLTGTVGNVTLQRLTGVAMDDRYFYLADAEAGKVYAWRGVPTASSSPAVTLDVGTGVGRIESDGRLLTVVHNVAGSRVLLYRVDELDGAVAPLVVAPGARFRFNLPGGAITAGNRLLVADTGFGRVLGWDDLADAAAGGTPTLILGAKDLEDTRQEIGRDTLFWPATLAFDGTYLWVGEFKFSERVLRYSLPPQDDGPVPQPTAGPSRWQAFLPRLWR